MLLIIVGLGRVHLITNVQGGSSTSGCGADGIPSVSAETVICSGFRGGSRRTWLAAVFWKGFSDDCRNGYEVSRAVDVYSLITLPPSPYISQDLENKTPDLGIGDLYSEIFEFKGVRGKIFQNKNLAVCNWHLASRK